MIQKSDDGWNRFEKNIRPLDLTKERVDALVESANEWLKIKEIADEETAARVQTFIRQVDEEEKAVSAEEKTQKKPLRDQIAAIGRDYEPIHRKLANIKLLVAPLRHAWLARKQAALVAEKRAQEAEAARLIREAQEAERVARARPTIENAVAVERLRAEALKAVTAADAPVERAQVRDIYGGRAASARNLWRAEIVDPLLVLIYYQEHPDVLEVLQRLANAEAPRAHDEGREIPGCRLIQKEVVA